MVYSLKVRACGRAGVRPDAHCRRATPSTAIPSRWEVFSPPRASAPAGRGWSGHAPPSRQRRLIPPPLHHKFSSDRFRTRPSRRLSVPVADVPCLGICGTHDYSNHRRWFRAKSDVVIIFPAMVSGSRKARAPEQIGSGPRSRRSSTSACILPCRPAPRGCGRG